MKSNYYITRLLNPANQIGPKGEKSPLSRERESAFERREMLDFRKLEGILIFYLVNHNYNQVHTRKYLKRTRLDFSNNYVILPPIDMEKVSGGN